MQGYRHIIPIQIRFVDLDMLGHINNANYLSYLELARITYFDKVLGERVDWTKAGFIMAKSIVDYLKPIFLRDEIRVGARCSRMGTKSFDIEYVFLRKKGDEEEIVATSSTVLVAFDYAENKTIAIPELWKQLMLDFDKN